MPKIKSKLDGIRKMKPRERFYYWIRERQLIKKRRESGQKAPWTEDEILNTYRFCNVRRRDDRVSKWLNNNWYHPNKDHKNMLVAATLARHLNNTDALEAVGFPDEWDPALIEEILDKRQESGLKNYSGAYMITARYGRDRAPETKQWQTLYRVCDPLWKADPRIYTNSMEKTWQELIQHMGISDFMGGQIVADLFFGISGDWRDKRKWAPVGPGSQRGYNRLHRRELTFKFDESEFMKFLEKQVHKWQAEFRIAIHAIDIQSCLCEYDKYERALFNEGRMKRKYHHA